MKRILIVLIMIVPLFGMSQDNSEHYLVRNEPFLYKLIEDSTFLKDTECVYSMIYYNPFVNMVVLDSINEWRKSQGFKRNVVNLDFFDKKMLSLVYMVSMEQSKKEDNEYVIVKMISDSDECKPCTNSICDVVLDDSTTTMDDITFKKQFLKRDIKYISLLYYQIDDVNNGFDEHIIVEIKRRFRRGVDYIIL